MTDTIETPTAPTKSRFAKFWDSDFAWSFRHSPVALIASLVVLAIAIGLGKLAADVAAALIAGRQRPPASAATRPSSARAGCAS